MPRNLPTGIRRTPIGYQAYVRVRRRFYAKRFPPGTSPTTMKQWRETQRVRVRLAITVDPEATTFAEDARAYLQAVATMPTIAWRTVDIQRWVKVLGGDRLRASITPLEIRQHLEGWRKTYAASTVNHRRTALMHLFTVLDGKSASNPAKDVPRYTAETQPPRAIPLPAIRALFARMARSQTKARLELMAWTGWPQAQIMRLTPADVVWGQAVRLAGRRKGKGTRDRWLPLLPQAWTALRTFKRLGCWGRFSTSSMRTSLRLAATHVHKDPKVARAIKAAVEDITPYDLRHSYGTMVAAITRDDTAVQELMLHADPRQTRLYTEAAVDPRIAQALKKVANQVPRPLKMRNA